MGTHKLENQQAIEFGACTSRCTGRPSETQGDGETGLELKCQVTSA